MSTALSINGVIASDLIVGGLIYIAAWQLAHILFDKLDKRKQIMIYIAIIVIAFLFLVWSKKKNPNR